MFTKNFTISVLSAIIAVIALFPALTLAQFHQSTYRYNGNANSTESVQSEASKMDAFGNFYIAFTGTHINTGADIVVMKFNANNPTTPAWVTIYTGNGAGEHSSANAIVLDNSGNIYVAGQITNSNQFDVFTLKYNNSGQLQWARRYNSVNNGDDLGTCITLDPSGNVIVAGTTYTEYGFHGDYLTIKYNNSGALQWVRTYDGPSVNDDFDEINAIASDASGNIVVTGKAGWTGTGYDMISVKYTPSGVGGALRYDGAEHSDDVGKKVVFDQYGNCYVTGSTIESGENSEITLIKYSTSNVMVWTRFYDNAIDAPADMKIDAAGNTYIAGYTGSGNEIDFVTIKHNSNGTRLWVSRYNEPSNNSVDKAAYVALDIYGNVYVTGTIHGSNGSDIGTVKYSPNGAQIGSIHRYNGSGNGVDIGVSVVVNSNGSGVYVTGWSFGGSLSGYDVVLIKYTYLVGVENVGSETPHNFSLSQNYPNPFNPTTNIKFSLPVSSNVKITVFDIQGKEVEVLVNEQMNAGTYEVDWNASALSSGAYFYSIKTESFTETKKMMLIK